MKKQLILALLSLLLLAACSPSAAETAVTADTTADTTADAAMDEDMATDETMAMDEDMAMDEPMATEDDMAMEDEMAMEDDMAMEDSHDDMAMTAAWQTISLTDARSGETFTLADFAGKTVLVEPMATWCTNCRRQLGNVQAARAQLDSDDFVFVALSVETTISNEDLARYMDGAGFDWYFAVATPDLLDALVTEYGRSIINPPSTPHFIIRPDGSTTDLTTGFVAPDDLVAKMQEAQG